MTVKSDVKRGFFLIIGALAALYVGSLIIGRLPQ